MEVRICVICKIRFYTNEDTQEICHSCKLEYEEMVEKYKVWRVFNE